MPPDPVAEAAHSSGVTQGPPTSTTKDGEGPCTLNTATSSQGGDVASVSEGNSTTTATTTTTTTQPIMYLLSPDLREAFQPVGATNKAYTFREVLILLKKYLFSKTHLFDASNKLYVNCGSDPLGVALGVERFHYNQTRYLISRNIIPIQSETSKGVCPAGIRYVPVTVNTTTTTTTPPAIQRTTSIPATVNLNTIPQPITQRTNSIPVTVNPTNNTYSQRTTSNPPFFLVVNNSNITNDRTGLAVYNRYTVASQPLTNLSHSPLVFPGTSRDIGGATRNNNNSNASSSNQHTVEISVPNIPDSNSDMESVYSYQGYETAYCRNTEYETSDEEEVQVEVEGEAFEEYELASDDAKEEEHSDDSDSMIEDVEVAVLAYALVQEESAGEEADDSDTDDQSGEDPELVGERWDCLSCGLKNKPFVRYCSKCWQLRKNWLPDRPKPKRGKRKPRPKKRHQRRRTESIVSDDQSCERRATNTNTNTPTTTTGNTSFKTNTNTPTTTTGNTSFKTNTNTPTSTTNTSFKTNTSITTTNTNTNTNMSYPTNTNGKSQLTCTFPHSTSQQEASAVSIHSTSQLPTLSTNQLPVLNISTQSTSHQPAPSTSAIHSTSQQQQTPTTSSHSTSQLPALNISNQPTCQQQTSSTSTIHSTSQQQAPTTSSHSTQQLSIPPTPLYSTSPSPQTPSTPPHAASLTRSDSYLEFEELPRTSSNASTVSLGNLSPERTHHIYHPFSQDSGISSQGFTDDMSIDVPVRSTSVVGGSGDHVAGENIQPSITANTVPVETLDNQRIQSKECKNSLPSGSGVSSTNKRQRPSSIDEATPRKRYRTNEEQEKQPCISDILKFLESSSGKYVEKQDLLSFIKGEYNKDNNSDDSSIDIDSGQICSICFLRPKNAIIVHGKLAHQATCYQCARRLLKTGSPCPVCRRKIHMVAKNIVA
ncbi:hypothetical protein Pmani_032528 [Petrolisthes manimaculis]|uniref:Uncharacterized protein n=1 Tax=Petrolisthes manimaculis TaxID=1843537 RepID=A0AAE1NSV9_9EUCA|nr:hypothetical protein Pmani_032528 [Petrolisthes manimaculis]